EVSRGSSNEDWIINIYDVGQQEPELIYSRTIPKEFGAIKQIKPIRHYGGSLGWPAEFDNYYVKTITYSEVVDGSETVGLGSNVEKFALTFNEQLKKPDDKVTLVNTTNENVEPIETKTIYNAETKKLEIMPKSLLDYGTSYRVVFENGGVASYSFTTTAAPISITPGSVTYSNESGTLAEIPISGTFSASYTVTAASSVADKHLVVILIAYNSQGVAVAFDVQSQPLTPPSVSNVTATLNNLKGGEITEVKALIHEYKDGIGFKPIK
ncbi:MAG: Ig-like domain-containing protein, partial [Clostridia bacterium]|nr:Ig-like domain-containing protein [Clostridia bacterium]